MANSPSAIPGAFDFYTTPRNIAPPRLSGAKSHIFQPPHTPNASASSSLVMSRSTVSMMSVSSAGERPTKVKQRKRMREEYHNEVELETPRGNRCESEHWDARDDMCAPGSPKPFVNTRYALAGGMDTPGMAAQQEGEMQSQYVDAGYRKSLGDVLRPSTRDLWGGYESGADYFGREVNGRRRYSQGFDGPRGDGWSKAAIQVAGAVVGKAWEFCKSSAAVFRGFQAGGGVRYNINPSIPNFEPVEQSIWEEKDGLREERGSPPLPGQYPIEELEFIPDYMDNPDSECTSPQPAAKRRQISANQEHSVNITDELAKNWVVVPQTYNNTPSKLPGQQRQSRLSMPTASASRRSTANTSSHRPASRAGFGAPSSARRSGLPNFTSRGSHAGSPALNSSRASYASPRSPANSSSKIPRATGSPLRNMHPPAESPSAREARRWGATKQRESREADESIRRLDAQLKAMIREGKEALGTKIEIQETDDLDLNPGRSRGVKARKWAI
ncbi:hypothetical protein BUE80_DR004984 [Diplocarpon rosae]|nr:hypothetical protein BUE80_DR004984 [Diplocarpon rosae]